MPVIGTSGSTSGDGKRRVAAWPKRPRPSSTLPLIDGSGRPAARNDAIVIEGNRIKSVGALPGDVELDDRRTVEVIDAGGQWIMPGLIDAHCHVSYGYPAIKGEGKGRGTTRPEFSTLKSARSVQKVLR